MARTINIVEIVEDLTYPGKFFGLFFHSHFPIPDLKGDRGSLAKLAAATLKTVVSVHCSSHAGNTEYVEEGLIAVGLLTAWMERRSREVNNRCQECNSQM